MWFNTDKNELQVTHSNFDYTSHATNHIDSTKPAYMVIPHVNGNLPDVIVYPKFSKGIYTINNIQFTEGLTYTPSGPEISFKRDDGALPARIVTAVSTSLSNDLTLPFECSLGVVHEKRPPKRFHWFIVSTEFPTVIHITSYPRIYQVQDSLQLTIRLYSPDSERIKERILDFESLNLIPGELILDELFSLDEFDGFGYVSIFSHYGGFFIYSSLRKYDSLTLEHSF